jgi:alanyl-tRNA synthetase
VELMGGAYPELTRAEPLIVKTLRQEEDRFRRTLGRGMILLEEAAKGLSPGDRLDGETAFRLYDTYGFPLDLTQDALRALDIAVDLEGFEAAMQRQKERAREAWTGSGDRRGGEVFFGLRERFGPTRFLGYDRSETTGEVLALLREGLEIAVAGPQETVEVLFDRTPFYAESGGQASDAAGTVEWDGGRAALLGVSKEAGDLFAHKLLIEKGVLTPGQKVRLELDAERRARTRANHSAAHLVHAALRNVLGPHVSQKGQLVDAERMRFDFSHGGPLSASELDRVEAEVNAVIRQNVAAVTRDMSPQEAIAEGALALFGEKYGESVRVLALGEALGGREGAYSVELCGGTHVARTGDIALFRIISESGVASGVRRIEALTGEAARRRLLEEAAAAQGAADALRSPLAEVPARVEALLADRKRLERELGKARRKAAMAGEGTSPAPAERINGLSFIGRVLQGVDGKGLRAVVEELRRTADVVAVIGVSEGKAAVAVSSAAPDRAASPDLVRAAVAAMGGQGGGGRPEFAQGGAPEGARAAEGLAAVRAALLACPLGRQGAR